MVKPEEKFFQEYKEGNSREREQNLQSHREIITQIPNISVTSLNIPFMLLLSPTLPLPMREPASPLAFESSLTGFSPLAHVGRIGNFFLCIAVPRPLAPLPP